ncbi:MAG TPA: DUF2891 domain-containing protein [Steroidobacteraceae bacterium]|nr:DUF2891 domain-containing protein [Steroidobacteraceae bacterium]
MNAHRLGTGRLPALVLLGMAALLTGTVGAVTIVSNRATQPPPPPKPLDVGVAAHFAELALACLHREYPNKIAHVMNSDADARPPRELTPAFYGCYDWHSAVHGHWLLVRLIRMYPGAPFEANARAALAQSLTPANIAGEVAYLQGDGRDAFERPYGLAWLLRLAAELREWNDEQGRTWLAALTPLENAAAAQLKGWLPQLTYPIRSGEHNQTALSFGLVWDWATVAGDEEMRSLLTTKANQFYLPDKRCPLAFEPSGTDFLSPCLAEADFMRRVLDQKAFSHWLSAFLPGLVGSDPARWLMPAVVTDRNDPKLAHLDGLNLSRAWMLEGIASALAEGDRRRGVLLTVAALHREAGLPAVVGAPYVGSHWLGTYAVYLTSRAGINAGRGSAQSPAPAAARAGT